MTVAMSQAAKVTKTEKKMRRNQLVAGLVVWSDATANVVSRALYGQSREGRPDGVSRSTGA
jgi:hypothetical protein